MVIAFIVIINIKKVINLNKNFLENLFLLMVAKNNNNTDIRAIINMN